MTVLAEYWINALWQLPLLLLVAAGAARLARGLGEKFVHRVWAAALVLAAILPAAHFGPFRQIPALAWRYAWAVLLRWTAGRGGIDPSGQPSVGVSMAGQVSNVLGFSLSPRGATLLLAVCLPASVYFTGRVLWAVMKTKAMCAAARPLSPSEGAELRWHELCTRMGVRGAFLKLSDRVSGPVVAGSRTVLLPAGLASRVSAGDLQAALAHELAHVRRGDFRKNLVYSALMLPIACHPCAWLLYRRMAGSREEVCDGMAAAALSGEKSYAGALVHLAVAMAEAGERAAVAIGIFDGSTLERRVSNMLNPKKQYKGARRRLALATVLLLTSGGVAAIAAIHVGVHATVEGADGGTSAAPAIRKVPGGVMAANAVSKVVPRYPQEAKANHDTVDGTVVLGLVIDVNGLPTRLHVARSLRGDYDQSALTAVQQWRWKPYTVDDVAVPVETTVNITYSLAR